MDIKSFDGTRGDPPIDEESLVVAGTKRMGESPAIERRGPEFSMVNCSAPQ